MPKKLNDSDLLGIVKFRALNERIKGVPEESDAKKVK